MLWLPKLKLSLDLLSSVLACLSPKIKQRVSLYNDIGPHSITLTISVLPLISNLTEIMYMILEGSYICNYFLSHKYSCFLVVMMSTHLLSLFE
jgi:hypothetical protein